MTVLADMTVIHKQLAFLSMVSKQCKIVRLQPWLCIAVQRVVMYAHTQIRKLACYT